MKRNGNTFSIRDRAGFSLVELLVYMVILGILMALVLTSFTQTQRRSAQQSGIAETQIETGVGLGLLRADLESAGFGLPWVFTGTPAYNEPNLSGAGNASTTAVPAALGSVEAIGGGLNASDRLVIRATNVILDANGQRWGYFGGNDDTMQSADTGRPLTNADWTIALEVSNNEHPENIRRLVTNGGTWGVLATNWANSAPSYSGLVLYGIGSANPVARPFNRADYFINVPATPLAHCAPNTGVLVKATLDASNNAAGGFALQPIVDCVADFQVVYLLDTNGDGVWETATNANGLAALNDVQIRNQVKEVRCYILLHEGGEDRSYTHPNAIINVGDVTMPTGIVQNFGQVFSLPARIGVPTWANYRWKLVSVAVTPKNLQ